MPERYGLPAFSVRCNQAAGSSLRCTASVTCSLYSCPPGTPADGTSTAAWSSGNTSVVRVVSPGTLAPVGPGYTTVTVATPGVIQGSAPVGVFGGAVMPVFGLQGVVYEGPSRLEGRIDGALVEVIDGLIAGRTAITGRPASPAIPGFFDPAPAAPGLFIINGVPPGAMRLRITRDGYAPVERDVTFTYSGGSDIDVQLQRR